MSNNCLSNREKSTTFTIKTRYLLNGIETAIILPTLNLFLLSLDSTTLNDEENSKFNSPYLGIALSGFSLSAFFISPFFGYASDFTQSTKLTVLVGNCFKIGGNFMYCFAQNPYLVIASQFLVGIGFGPTPAMIGMLSGATPLEDRTGKITKVVFYRQLGALIGPLCFFVLRMQFMFFKIGQWSMNNYTLPTFFVSILWIIHTLLVLFFYHDLPPHIEPNPYGAVINPEGSQFPDKNVKSFNSHSVVENNGGVKIGSAEVTSRHLTNFCHNVNRDLIRDTSIACLFTGFASTFVNSGLLALVTPLSLEFFGWKGFENNIYLLGLACVYILSLLALEKLTTKFSDEFLIVVGQSGLIVSCLLMLLFCLFRSDSVFLLVLLVLIGCVIALGYPFAFAPLISLISKLTSERNRGFNLALLSASVNLGSIIGKIWTTSLLDSQITLSTIVTIAISIMPWVMLVDSFRQFERRRLYIADRNMRESNNTASERTPLLS